MEEKQKTEKTIKRYGEISKKVLEKDKESREHKNS